jgi:hypothetical protein
VTVARAVYYGADEPSNVDPLDGFVANRSSQRNLTKLLGLPVPYRVTTKAAARALRIV